MLTDTQSRVLAAMSEAEYRTVEEIAHRAGATSSALVGACRALAEAGLAEGRIRRRVDWRRLTQAERK